jgi:NAD(P)H-flavin reductase
MPYHHADYATQITMTESSVFIRSSDVAVTDLDGETVLLDIDAGQYFGLNVVGTDVFRMAERPVSIADIVDHLDETYNDVSRDELRRDVMEFIRQMQSHGLIHPAESKTA